MKGISFRVAVASIALLIAVTAQAAVSVGAHGGTLGAGGELGMPLSDHFNARLGFNAFNYSYRGTYDQINYDSKLRLHSATLLLDWHPFAGIFRLTAGAVSNRNRVGLSSTPSGPVTIGSTTYTPSQVGTITGTVSFKPTVPYLGIGWGKAPSSGGFGVDLDVGVLFQGSPKVSLSSNGSLANDPSYQAQLRQEEQKAQNDMKNFKYYPVISLGLEYRF